MATLERVQISKPQFEGIVEGRLDGRDDASVANAPRPILGDTTWNGDFVDGRFYALGSEDEYGDSWAKNGAVIIEPLTREQVVEILAAQAKDYGKSLDELVDAFTSLKSLARMRSLPWHESWGE